MAKNNEVILKITIDGKDSIGVIKNLEQSLKSAREELKNINLNGEQLSKAKSEFQKLTAELDKLKSSGAGNSFAGLTQEVKVLESELKLLPLNTQQFTDKLTELNSKKTELEGFQNKLKDGFNLSNAQVQIQKLSQELDKIKNSGGENGLSALKIQAQLLEKEIGLLAPSTDEFNAKLIQLNEREKDIEALQSVISGKGEDEKSNAEKRVENLRNELDKLKGNGGGASLTVLRKELKLLDLELGTLTDGTAEYSKKLQEIANKKDQFKDLQLTISALNPEERIAAFVTVGNTLVSSFTAAQSAISLFAGNTDKETNEAIQKVIGGLGLLTSVQQIVSSKDQIGIVARILGYKSLQKEVATTALSQQALDGATKTTTTSFISLRAVLTSLGIIALISAVALLSNNWGKLRESISGVSKEQKLINSARAEAAKSAAEEQSKVKLLVDEYKVANTSQLRKKEIVEELQRISPNYFETLDKEKATIGEVTASYDNWSEAILYKSKIDALAKQISENNIKLVENENKSINDQVSILQTLGNAFLSMGNAAQFSLSQTDSGLKNKKEETDKLTNSTRVLQSELEKTRIAMNNKGGDPSINKIAEKKDDKKSEDDAKKEAERLFKIKLEAEDKAFAELKSKQKTQEDENKLSYDKQKQYLEKFFEERKAIILNNQTNILADNSLTDTEKFSKIKQQNEELNKLEQERVQASLFLEQENSNKQLANIKIFEQQQLDANSKSIKSKEDVEKQKTDIVTEFANKRGDIENTIVKSGVELQKNANDELTNSIVSNSQKIQDANSAIIEQTSALNDSLVELFNSVGATIQQALDDSANLGKEKIVQDLEIQTTQIKNEQDTQTRIIQTQFDQGLITKEQFEQKKLAVEKTALNSSTKAKDDAEKKKLEIDKRTGIFKKAFEITNVGIDTTKTVANLQLKVTELIAAAALNPLLLPVIPLVQAQIPIAIGVGLLQTARIASQKFASGGVADGDISKQKYVYINNQTQMRDIVKYEQMYEGGIIKKGTTDRADDVPIMVSKDETIINAKSSRLFKKELSFLNSYNNWGARFADGGIASLNSNSTSNNSNSSLFIGGNSKKTEDLLQTLIDKTEENTKVAEQARDKVYRSYIPPSDILNTVSNNDRLQADTTW